MPTACRSPSFSFKTKTGSNQAKGKSLNILLPRSLRWIGDYIICCHLIAPSKPNVAMTLISACTKNEKVALASAGLFSLCSNDLPINSNFAKVVLLLLLPYIICFIDWQT